MATKKITDLTALTTAVGADLMHIVDVGDDTMSPQGTNKKITITDLATAVAGAGSVSSVTGGTALTASPTSGAVTVSLDNTAVTAGAYTAADITVDAQGRVTAAANGSTGAGTLEDLTDVSIIGTKLQGDVITYNTGTGKWMRNTGLQTLLSRFKASGTGAQVYDTLNDTSKGYVDVQATSAKIGLGETALTVQQTSPGTLTFSVAAGGSGVETQFNAIALSGQTTADTAHFLLRDGTDLRLENASAYETWLRPNASAASNLTVGLPATSGTLALTSDIGGGTVTSVAMTVPSAFAISGSPITTSGTLALSVGGTTSQYLDGTGALQTFPTIPTQGLLAVVDDTTPQLGGNLDVQAFEIDTSVTNGSIVIAPKGTGVLEVKGATNSAAIQLNCEINTHGVKIQSPPHSAAANYTLVLPDDTGTNGQVMTTDGSGNLSFTTVSGGGGGTVTAVTGTAPIVSSGGNTPAISITAATTSAAGSMSSADKTKLDNITTNYEEDELNTGQNILMNTSIGVASNKIVDIMGDALADTSNANSKKLIGYHTGSGVCVLQGMVDAVSAINSATAGGPLWIGASGVFSATAPTTTNYYSRVVGYFVGTGQGGEVICYFDPSKDWVQIS